jgi:hypothetical protein
MQIKNFEELINTIEKKKIIANSELPTDPRTYTTKLGHIKRAKEDLKQLFMDYRNAVKQNALFILASGSQQESFVEIAETEFDCFTVEADEIFKKIIEPISHRYYDNQQSSPALFDLMMSSFNDICDDIGILGYPAVLFESKYLKRLKSQDDLLQLTKKAFGDKVGNELVGLYAAHTVANKAIKKGYKGKTIPIIINSKDKNLISNLEASLKNINPNVFKLSITKKQSEETVKEKLLKIKEKVK